MRMLVLAALVVATAACDRVSMPNLSFEDPANKAKAAAPAGDDFAFAEMDIASLQARMARGELTSRALTQAYLDRIAAIDDAGPKLNAVLELNPLALQEAETRDAERRAGRVRGPLHGIPVLLKDNIDATPMANSAGTLALANHQPKADAFLVGRLRAAGAVVLGKTNLSEWANFRSSRSTSGWSSRGGLTRNPYVLDRNACGSSSGTGVAIAASLAAVGVGTETDGSIICPSAVNGLVGVKPTVGLVSRSGIIPISRTQDTAGPMARSVADAAALLSVLVGRDERDPVTADSSGRAVFDYEARLRPDALRGARLGVVRQAMGYHAATDAAMERAIAAMRRAGAEVVDVIVPTWGQWDAAESLVLLHEFKAGVEHYLASSGAPVSTLAHVIDYNQRHSQATMPHFGQELLEQARATNSLGDPVYLSARSDARRLARTEGLEATLAAHGLDALIAPATSPAWRTDLAQGDRFLGAGYSLAAVAGTPSVTVPMGDVKGLPVGVIFMGPAWSEPRLLGLAYSFEQATRARKAPRFVASIGADPAPLPAAIPAPVELPSAATPSDDRPR
ncbi:amidase [Lysobacter ruishenii]|uniref:Amidase n=2 Tax=Aerolutibacter ruishenii TaxID=686800 RepID=A0A562LKK8_9GAMM|nr:amidase [Lysobacter ruishenii]TWI08141.1 amidase [Lysobacter ruishenii]